MPHEGGTTGRFCLGMLSVVQLSMWTRSRSDCWDKGEGQGGFCARGSCRCGDVKEAIGQGWAGGGWNGSSAQPLFAIQAGLGSLTRGLVRDHGRELGWLHVLGEKDPSSCSCPVAQGCNRKSRLKGEKREGRDPPGAHPMASNPSPCYVAIAQTIASLHV